jgi:hypothetical protein
MKWTWPDVHSVVTVVRALAITAFAFLHSADWTLQDIAFAYMTLNGGQTIGALGQGGKRWMQGGSTRLLRNSVPQIV